MEQTNETTKTSQQTTHQKAEFDSLTDYLCNQVEVCQAKGAYSIKDAYILKQCVDFLRTKTCDNPQVDQKTALDGVIQAVNIGQQKGAFDLSTAYDIYKTLEKLSTLNEISVQEQAV